MKFLPSSLVYFEPENTMNNEHILPAWYMEQEKKFVLPVIRRKLIPTDN